MPDYEPDKLQERIISSPEICHGQPVIRGTRIMVWLILEYLANGDSIENVLSAYPDIHRDDVKACLAFAAKAAKSRIIPIEIESRALQV
jgi:uncharacterized protein (DUF433 family)